MAIMEVHFNLCEHLKCLAGNTVSLFCLNVSKQAEELFA